MDYLPFSSHFDTNYVPSDVETESIKHLLRDREAQVRKLDQEIAQIEANLGLLRSQRQKFSDTARGYHSLISPARRLPDDILREIFIRCLPTRRNAIMSAQEAPVLLGRICSRWRRVAYSSPRLWTTLHIPVNSDRDAAIPDPRIGIMREWLGRAGTCPLSLSIRREMYQKHYWSNIQSLEHLLSHLTHTSEKWRKLDLVVVSAYPNLVTNLWATINQQNGFPLLESLRIRLDVFHLNDLDDRGMPIVWNDCKLLSAPRLRELTISAHPKQKLSLLPISWSQLTYLDLEESEKTEYERSHLSYGRTLWICQQALGLVVLKVSLADDAGAIGWPSPDTRIVLHALQYLSITLPSFHSLITPTFFSYLDFPSLNSLSLNNRHNSISGPPYALISLFESVGASLEWLCLCSGFIHQDHLVELLKLTPSLIQLALKHSEHHDRDPEGFLAALPSTEVDNEIINSLTPCGSAIVPHLCPRLQYFRWEDETGFSDQSLLDFIREKSSWSNGVAKLKQVQVTFDRPAEIDIASEISDLVEDGLILQLKYLSHSSDFTLSPLDGIVDNFDEHLAFGW